jgi:hypothetical protein
VHRALKPIIGVFAVIGIAYAAFAVFANFFLMDCTFVQAGHAISPNGEHFGVFEQRICKDPDKSWSRVLMGKRGTQVRDVLMEVQGTTRVSLTWNSDQELVVSYPRSAVVKKYDVDFGRPRVTLRPTDPGS